MIPLKDDNPTLKTPWVNHALLVALVLSWVFVQGAGFDSTVLAASVCNLGLVPGEITGRAAVGVGVPMGAGMACVVDTEPINVLTPLTSMFLHGGWGHLAGNCIFLWVFGNNVEDSMGKVRFLLFYVVCGLAAAGAQIAVNPASVVPMVGASGAISGVLGGYLVLYPRVRVSTLFIWIIFIQVVRLPAYILLVFWIGYQILLGLPQLTEAGAEGAGVAFWAHIGGFAAGMILIKLMARKDLIEAHRRLLTQATSWRGRP